jgi:hypothetical protein
LLDDLIELSACPLQFFDLLESLQPNPTTAVLHHLAVLKQFRQRPWQWIFDSIVKQQIVTEGRRRGLRNGFALHQVGRTVVAAQLSFDGLTQVLNQVEAVSHLPRLRRALPSRLGIKAAPVSTDDFDSGMFCQPSCRRPGGTILQHIDDFPTFKIHHNGSVSGSLQPTPVVDTNDAKRLARKNRAAAFEVAKDSIVTLRHTKPTHQPLGRATADGVSNQMRQLCHPSRLSRIGLDHSIGLISESPTFAWLIATSPSGHSDLKFDNSALDGQILHPSHIETVATGGLKAATRASGIPWGRRFDDPSLTAEFRVYNPDAGAGLPSWFDFHQCWDRSARPVRQPGHFTGTEIATDPI